MKQGCFWGIQVLRLALIEDAPTETDHTTPRIANRKHDAIPETIVVARALAALPFLGALDHEAGR